jgi:hypothetical protein
MTRLVSSCCGKALKIGGASTTRYYVCSRCRQPCEAMPEDSTTDTKEKR